MEVRLCGNHHLTILHEIVLVNAKLCGVRKFFINYSTQHRSSGREIKRIVLVKIIFLFRRKHVLPWLVLPWCNKHETGTTLIDLGNLLPIGRQILENDRVINCQTNRVSRFHTNGIISHWLIKAQKSYHVSQIKRGLRNPIPLQNHHLFLQSIKSQHDWFTTRQSFCHPAPIKTPNLCSPAATALHIPQLERIMP